MRGEKTYNIYSGDVMNPDLVKQGMEEKEYTGMLHKALECAVALHTFPKTTVDVFALILQSGGGMELFLPHLYFLLNQIYLWWSGSETFE